MSIKTFTVLTESQKGAANGLAELNGSGNVPSTQLPSYVDDVIEGSINSNNTVFTDSDGKTVTPESGKIYVDTTTNKSYRWSGTQYVVIASDLALGETDSTAYAGNKGKALADKIGTTDISGTGSTITEAIKSLDEDKLDKTGDSKDNTTTFTSSDVADGSATGWTSVPALTTGEKHASIFSKMSQMFKNIRYLYKMLGTTDISAIGDGTATGAISSLNSNLESMTNSTSVFKSRHIYNFSHTNLVLLYDVTEWYNVMTYYWAAKFDGFVAISRGGYGNEHATIQVSASCWYGKSYKLYTDNPNILAPIIVKTSVNDKTRYYLALQILYSINNARLSISGMFSDSNEPEALFDVVNKSDYETLYDATMFPRKSTYITDNTNSNSYSYSDIKALENRITALENK